jgi:site-specific DNA recombinase
MTATAQKTSGTIAEPIPMIGYIRVSLAREEMISPEIQKKTISSWAARSGRHIIDWVVDLDRSGRNFRRKVIKAIERIEGREAVEIGVYRYDRWGRNAVESLANVKRVELAGGQVHSATEPVDAETAVGRYTRTNAFGIAEMQSDLISEGWKGALANRVDRGIPSAGTPRFGYIRLGKVLDPYPVTDRFRYRHDPADKLGERYEPDWAAGTPDVLLEMYDRYIDGWGFNKIAQWLNELGVLNTRGARWSDVTVRNVLDSGFGAGLLQLHDADCRCGKPSSCSHRMHVPGVHQAVVPSDTWERYLKARKSRAPQAARARYALYPLSGLVQCGHCFGPMSHQSGGHPQEPGFAMRCARWHHYRDCPDAPFPSRAFVEEELLKVLGVWVSGIDQNSKIVKARKSAHTSAVASSERLTKSLADIDASLRRLAKQRAMDDRMPAAIYDETRDEILATRASVVEELSRAATVADANSGTEFHPMIVGLIEGWDVLPASAIRELLTKFVRHVAVTRVKGKLLEVQVTPLWEPCGCPWCVTPGAPDG